MSNRIDLTGQLFRCWRVIAPAEAIDRKGRPALWRCRCEECGYERDLGRQQLRSRTPKCKRCGVRFTRRIPEGEALRTATRHGAFAPDQFRKPVPPEPAPVIQLHPLDVETAHVPGRCGACQWAAGFVWVRGVGMACVVCQRRVA